MFLLTNPCSKRSQAMLALIKLPFWCLLAALSITVTIIPNTVAPTPAIFNARSHFLNDKSFFNWISLISISRFLSSNSLSEHLISNSNLCWLVLALINSISIFFKLICWSFSFNLSSFSFKDNSFSLIFKSFFSEFSFNLNSFSWYFWSFFNLVSSNFYYEEMI